MKIDYRLGEGRDVAKPRRKLKPMPILDKARAGLYPSGESLHHVRAMIESRKANKLEIDIVAAGGNTSRHFCLCDWRTSRIELRTDNLHRLFWLPAGL
jgi:hypothetical protein